MMWFNEILGWNFPLCQTHYHTSYGSYSPKKMSVKMYSNEYPNLSLIPGLMQFRKGFSEG